MGGRGRDRVAGVVVGFGFFIEGDADGKEFVEGVVRADDCLGFEVGVEVEEVKEGFLQGEAFSFWGGEKGTLRAYPLLRRGLS